METAPAGGSLFVVGRLDAIAPREQRRGHRVRARRGELLLDSTFTDSSGRFLVEWRDDGRGGRTVIELLDPAGEVSESAELARDELDSPPVLVFSGRRVLGARVPVADAPADRFEAEGDAPICVASACQEVTLSWISPPGTRVALISGGKALRDGLASRASVKVVATRSTRYLKRAWPSGSEPGRRLDLSVEVRRYPSLSLVMDGNTFRTASSAEIGASISCPAGDEGLSVEVASSDLGMVPRFEIRIPPGSVWGSARVSLGRKDGTVKVTGSAPGYARDEVTFNLLPTGPSS